jgi:hypothetical protein
MARTKKLSQKVRENLAAQAASQALQEVDPGSTQVDEEQDSQVQSQSVTITGSKTPSYVWTQLAELFLVDELQDAIRRGERVENGFHPRIWDRIMGRFPDEGLEQVTRTQLKNKHDAV